MTRLYPQLPDVVARETAAEHASVPPDRLAALAAFEHQASTYSATGGNRIQPVDLSRLRDQLVAAAKSAGYPAPVAEGQRRAFDADSADILLREMDITPAEASNTRVWSFLACVVVPDLVRWRFPGGLDGTPAERFMGGTRGIRNLLGRVWWRAYLLGTPTSDAPTDYVYRLGEDELVQITERPSIAGSRRVARQLCDSFIEAGDRFPDVSRSELMRESMKRVRRLAGLLSFDALPEDELIALIDDAFETAGRRASVQ